MIFFEVAADPLQWFHLPLHWTEEDQDEKIKWSLMCAEAVRHQHKTWWRRPKRLKLAERFLQITEVHPAPNIPADQAFLYAGDPRRIPQPFYALAGPLEGVDCETGLRTIVQATKENPVRPPEVADFHSPRLRQGLRSLRYFGSEGALNVSLNYGWWSEELKVYASVRTVSTEHDWLNAHLGVFDGFARSIWLNPEPE
jgi:hypothetical protein